MRKTIIETRKSSVSRTKERIALSDVRSFIRKQKDVRVLEEREEESLIYLREFITESKYRFFMLVSIERSLASAHDKTTTEQVVDGY